LQRFQRSFELTRVSVSRLQGRTSGSTLQKLFDEMQTDLSGLANSELRCVVVGPRSAGKTRLIDCVSLRPEDIGPQNWGHLPLRSVGGPLSVTERPDRLVWGECLEAWAWIKPAAGSQELRKEVIALDSAKMEAALQKTRLPDGCQRPPSSSPRQRQCFDDMFRLYAAMQHAAELVGVQEAELDHVECRYRWAFGKGFSIRDTRGFEHGQEPLFPQEQLVVLVTQRHASESELRNALYYGRLADDDGKNTPLLLNLYRSKGLTNSANGTTSGGSSSGSGGSASSNSGNGTGASSSSSSSGGGAGEAKSGNDMSTEPDQPQAASASAAASAGSGPTESEKQSLENIRRALESLQHDRQCLPYLRVWHIRPAWFGQIRDMVSLGYFSDSHQELLAMLESMRQRHISARIQRLALRLCMVNCSVKTQASHNLRSLLKKEVKRLEAVKKNKLSKADPEFDKLEQDAIKDISETLKHLIDVYVDELQDEECEDFIVRNLARTLELVLDGCKAHSEYLLRSVVQLYHPGANLVSGRRGKPAAAQSEAAAAPASSNDSMDSTGDSKAERKSSGSAAAAGGAGGAGGGGGDPPGGSTTPTQANGKEKEQEAEKEEKEEDRRDIVDFLQLAAQDYQTPLLKEMVRKNRILERRRPAGGSRHRTPMDLLRDLFREQLQLCIQRHDPVQTFCDNVVSVLRKTYWSKWKAEARDIAKDTVRRLPKALEEITIQTAGQKLSQVEAAEMLQRCNSVRVLAETAGRPQVSMVQEDGGTAGPAAGGHCPRQDGASGPSGSKETARRPYQPQEAEGTECPFARRGCSSSDGWAAELHGD